MNVSPITLEGMHVRLEPLALKHADDLFSRSRSPELWEFLIAAPIQTLEQMQSWIEKAVKQTEAHTQIWFAIIRQVDHRAVGVTSFLNISQADRGLEIGGTWLSTEVWRTASNTE